MMVQEGNLLGTGKKFAIIGAMGAIEMVNLIDQI